MTDITITGKVAERLQRLAEDRNRTVEEILEDALDTLLRGDDQDDAIEPPPGTLARMAWVARRNPINVDATDISERSRDILRNEYTEHLLKRQSASDEPPDG